MDAPPRIAVCGSLVMDLVCRVPRHPRPGETVLGREFATYLGGKGFNQALAARRLGAAVDLVGCIGEDEFGAQFEAAALEAGIGFEGVRRVEAGTGVAVPVVDDEGENTIVMIPRANMSLTAAGVESSAAQLSSCDALLLQLEVPVEACLAAAALARDSGAIVVWNLAPFGPLPEGALSAADLIIVNEAEAEALLGAHPSSPLEALQAAHRMRMLGAAAAVVTLGAEGAVYEDARGAGHAPGHRVQAVDTVGAGDAFCAALAWALARGEALAKAVRYANAAGALATLTPGAGPSMPRLDDVLTLAGVPS